ncbi:MAG: hypothetical protein LBU42_03120 [Prevotellaceae bacterium]|jgi:hypothetical protein|nr:hypothetical protein [Prevotellaceae bacterium]
MTKLEEMIHRTNQVYMDNMQREIDNAKSEEEKKNVARKRDKRLELINKNRTDNMPEFK